MSDQGYTRAGASHWRATVIFEQLVHMAHEERPNYVTRLWTGLWTGLWGEFNQQVRLVRRNQDEGGNGYFSPWGYKRIVWPALAHA